MAFVKAWTNILDAAVDPDSPVDTALVTAIRDNAMHLREWLGNGYTSGADQDHNHNGVNSAPVLIKRPFFQDTGDGSLGSLVHSANANIAIGCYNYTDFTINSGITLTVTGQGPLIIRCTGTLTIAGTLNAAGTGAVVVAPGDGVSGVAGTGNLRNFIIAGGSGGGSEGANIGGGAFNLGGATGNGGSITEASIQVILASMGMLLFGGASGASGLNTTNYGGNGGGLVILIANSINFTGAISCAGSNATVRGGGGGGGVIVTAAKTYTNNTGTRTISGGSFVEVGGNGGAGWQKSLTI